MQSLFANCELLSYIQYGLQYKIDKIIEKVNFNEKSLEKTYCVHFQGVCNNLITVIL